LKVNVFDSPALTLYQPIRLSSGWSNPAQQKANDRLWSRLFCIVIVTAAQDDEAKDNVAAKTQNTKMYFRKFFIRTTSSFY